MATIIEEFAIRLNELRENKGLKRQEVADAIGISRASLEYYEKGKRKPDVEVLLKLADYYEVTCDFLLRGISTKNVAINKEIGLTDKAIENLKQIQDQAIGKNIGESFAEEISRLELEIELNNTDEKRREKWKSYYDKENSKITFDEWMSLINSTEQEEIEDEKRSSITEASFVRTALNTILEKDEAKDFFIALYLYLFSEVDEETKGLYGTAGADKCSADQIPVELDLSFFNEMNLLRINSYLNKWQEKGKIKIYDLETRRGINGNNPEKE